MLSDTDVRGWVEEAYGLAVREVVRVESGADRGARTWRAVTDAGTVAVKVVRGGDRRGAVVPAWLASRGVPGVPAPLTTRDGRSHVRRDGLACWLTPWIEGERPVDVGMDLQTWTRLGEVLRSLHEAPLTLDVLGALRREVYDPGHALARVAAVDEALASGRLADGRPVADDALAAGLAATWRAEHGRLEVLAGWARTLGSRLAVDLGDVVICHGDPHVGNVVVDACGQPWLLDWDDAILAPREHDLMFVDGGVLAFAPVAAAEEWAFFDGYGDVHLDHDRLTYARCVRALEDVTDPALGVLDPALDLADRERLLAILRGVVSPDGLVHLTLSEPVADAG